MNSEHDSVAVIAEDLRTMADRVADYGISGMSGRASLIAVASRLERLTREAAPQASAPRNVVVQSLVEAARCYGVAQAKGDADAIDYWNDQTNALIRRLATTDSAIQSQQGATGGAVDRDALAQLAYETWRDTPTASFPDNTHWPKWLAVVDAIHPQGELIAELRRQLAAAEAKLDDACEAGVRAGVALGRGASGDVVPDVIGAAVGRFLGWTLPRDFNPDCGISFDGRKDDQWNKGKTWPIGTNLLSADQARAMFTHCLHPQAAGSAPGSNPCIECGAEHGELCDPGCCVAGSVASGAGDLSMSMFASRADYEAAAGSAPVGVEGKDGASC